MGEGAKRTLTEELMIESILRAPPSATPFLIVSVPVSASARKKRPKLGLSRLPGLQPLKLQGETSIFG